MSLLIRNSNGSNSCCVRLRGIIYWVATILVLLFASAPRAEIVSYYLGADGNNQGLTPVEKNGKWGYVNSKGNFVIPAKFESAKPFSEGLAAVELNKRFGYIGPDGSFVIPPRYIYAGPFSSGFAWVCTHKPWTPFGKGEYGVWLFAEYTYIDRAGREIMRPFKAEFVGNFSEGLAAVRPGTALGGCKKMGYLNANGKWAIKPRFDEARDFSGGLAAVNEGANCHMGGKWGYVDRDGRLVIPFRYRLAGQFSNGYACVLTGKQWQRIDTKGKPTSAGLEACER